MTTPQTSGNSCARKIPSCAQRQKLDANLLLWGWLACTILVGNVMIAEAKQDEVQCAGVQRGNGEVSMLSAPFIYCLCCAIRIMRIEERVTRS